MLVFQARILTPPPDICTFSHRVVENQALFRKVCLKIVQHNRFGGRIWSTPDLKLKNVVENSAHISKTWSKIEHPAEHVVENVTSNPDRVVEIVAPLDKNSKV